MHHLYLSYQPNTAALEAEREELVRWCEQNSVQHYKFLEEKITDGRVPLKALVQLYADVQEGDTVVTPSLPRMGRSLRMLAMAMRMLYERKVSVVCLQEGTVYSPDAATQIFIQMLDMAISLDTTIHGQRSEETIFRRRTTGEAVGRPSGAKRKPSKFVLYGKEEELVALHKAGRNPREIAQALGVSRTTVVNYLRSKGL